MISVNHESIYLLVGLNSSTAPWILYCEKVTVSNPLPYHKSLKSI